MKTRKEEKKQTKITLENNRFVIPIGELAKYTECLYSNDAEFIKEVRNLLTKNGISQRKVIDMLKDTEPMVYCAEVDNTGKERYKRTIN